MIFATDVGVKGRERFAGKPVIASGVKRAINEPDVMIAEALRAASRSRRRARWSRDCRARRRTPATRRSDRVGAPHLRQVLLTGVSYMIPFVAAGGLLIALGFLLGGYEIADFAGDIVLDNCLDQPARRWPRHLPRRGAVSRSGRWHSASWCRRSPATSRSRSPTGQASHPGFTAGAVAVFVGAGFIGGLVGGLIAGFVALWIGRIPLPHWLRGLMPVVIIPLFATIIVGGLMFLVLGTPARGDHHRA